MTIVTHVRMPITSNHTDRTYILRLAKSLREDAFLKPKDRVPEIACGCGQTAYELTDYLDNGYGQVQFLAPRSRTLGGSFFVPVGLCKKALLKFVIPTASTGRLLL